MTLLELQTLRKRADFLRLNRGRRFAVPGLVLQSAPTPDAPSDSDLARPAPVRPAPVRMGLTVTKKIGNAVVRNKNRRRLREAARQVLAVEAQPGHDYVLIARATTKTRSFEELKSDLKRALKGVHKAQKPKAARSAPKSSQKKEGAK